MALGRNLGAVKDLDRTQNTCQAPDGSMKSPSAALVHRSQNALWIGPPRPNNAGESDDLASVADRVSSMSGARNNIGVWC